MTNKKITKRERFTTLLNLPQVQADPEMVAFIEHELELLAKKNATEKKPTAVQLENEKIKAAILGWMNPNQIYTITEIQKGAPGCAELTNQKITSLVGQMVKGDLVEKIEDKRKSYFKKIIA